MAWMLLGGCALPSMREAAHPHSPKPPSHPKIGSCLSTSFCSRLCGRLWQGAGTTMLALPMESCLSCSRLHPPCEFTCLLHSRGRSPNVSTLMGISLADAGDKDLSLHVCQSTARLLCPPALGIQQNNSLQPWH